MLAAFLAIVGVLFLGAQRKKALVSHKSLSPEEERLLSLLVLYQKDQAYLPGQKRYLNTTLAHEAATLAASMGLTLTVQTMKVDKPLPSAEMFPGQGVSVAQATLVYSRTGRL